MFGLRQDKPRWLGLVALFGLALTTTAQEKPPALPAGATARETLRVESNLVNMFFTVRDKKHKLVKNLRRDQFRVTDNEQPQTITHFAEEFDAPLALAIVFDKSKSVRSNFDFQRQATVSFLRSVVRPGKDQVLLITFDKEPHLAVPFTDQVEKVEQALAGLEADGGSALFDAARMAIEEHLSQAGARRKVLILVSDGEDTVSWTTRGEVLSLALSRNISVYSLGVAPDGPGKHRRARRNLLRLTQDTGGLALFPKQDPEELAELFERIEEELRHQYSLGYALPPPDGRVFHQVVIQSSKKGYRVQARRGYYSAWATPSAGVASNR
ncbi:MAG: VWA domain-containing protein [Candidatus Acidoferrales bacterium]